MSSYSWLFLLLIGALLSANAFLFSVFRRELRALWREPMLRVPVVIFESDDWGAGPREQAACLRQLRGVLGRHRDAHGRPPVMTLGLTLAAPNVTEEADGSLAYGRTFLDHAEQLPILDEIHRGISEGLFTAQLHGMEHFQPDVLCDAARVDPAVKEWLIRGDQYSELLPDHLQSRWIDTRRLPSTDHPDAVIEAAVARETGEFARIFGRAPRVAVPPTFVWTRRVEQAWAQQGVRFLVTCGMRFTGRDQGGRLIDEGTHLRNGDITSGLVCLVRDAYFEPFRGHRAADVLDTLRRYAACARPLLLETHRSNFTALNPRAEEAFVELDDAVAQLLALYPYLRFLSTEELGQAIVSRDPDLIEGSFKRRLHAWAQRAARLPGFRRYARLSGARVMLSLLSLAACRN